MYQNVGHICISPLYDGKTYRVSLRDLDGKVIMDDTGEPETQYIKSRTPAIKEAKRLARAYSVKVIERR